MNDKEDVCTGYPCGSLPFFYVFADRVVIEKKQITNGISRIGRASRLSRGDEPA